MMILATTASELESLVLEITLIKKYNPKYNILLKDDKSYPYIELENSKCPTLKLVRNVKNKKNKNNLYGPFPNVGAAKNIVNMLNRVYPLRKCEHLKKELNHWISLEYKEIDKQEKIKGVEQEREKRKYKSNVNKYTTICSWI